MPIDQSASLTDVNARLRNEAREGTAVIFRLPWPAATAMLGTVATVIPE